MVGAYQLGLPVRLTLTGTRETRFAAARDSCFSFFDAVALAGFPERLGSLELSDYLESLESLDFLAPLGFLGLSESLALLESLESLDFLAPSGPLGFLESDFFDWATRASSLAGRWGSGLAAGPAGT